MKSLSVDDQNPFLAIPLGKDESVNRSLAIFQQKMAWSMGMTMNQTVCLVTVQGFKDSLRVCIHDLQ